MRSPVTPCATAGAAPVWLTSSALNGFALCVDAYCGGSPAQLCARGHRDQYVPVTVSSRWRAAAVPTVLMLVGTLMLHVDERM